MTLVARSQHHQSFQFKNKIQNTKTQKIVLNFEIQLGNFRGQKTKEGSDERAGADDSCSLLYLDQSQKGSSSSRGRGLALGTLHTFAQSESWKKEKSQRPMAWGTQQKEPRPKHSREQPNNKPVFFIPSSSLTPSWIQEEEVSLRPGAKHTRENLFLFWASSSSSSCAIKIKFNRETDNDDRFFVRSRLYRFVHYLIFFFSFSQVQLL
jgi:hypothetical protein